MLSSTSGVSNLYSQLIDQMISSERAPARRLENKRSEQNVFKGVLSDFDSKLSDLRSELKDLSSKVSNPFGAVAANTSEGTTAFSVTADDFASPGSHSLDVQQLAQTDTRVSQSYTSDEAGTDSLRSFFDTNGAQSFSISVANPTDADPDNRVDIAVNVDPVGTTNKEILEEISSAINTAMASAVDDGTLDGGNRASVSLVNQTSDTVRLSMRSGETGYKNRLEFTDSAGGLLNALQVTQNDTTTDDGSGGQIYAVGTSETDSALSSKFVLDGLTLYRNTNSVDDAIKGLTISLEETTTQPQNFSVAPDEKAIEDTVKSFIEKYNGVLDYVQNKSKIDPETDTRGPFASESRFRSLRFNLRTDAAQPVTGLPNDAPQRLSNIGITIENNGKLELSDTDKLTAAISENADAVQNLFSSDDGIGTRMLERVERFVGSDGVLNRRKESIDRSNRRIDDRIDRIDRRLERRREQLQAQFAQLQAMQQQIQGQGRFF